MKSAEDRVIKMLDQLHRHPHLISATEVSGSWEFEGTTSPFVQLFVPNMATGVDVNGLNILIGMYGFVQFGTLVVRPVENDLLIQVALVDKEYYDNNKSLFDRSRENSVKAVKLSIQAWEERSNGLPENSKPL